MTPNSRTKSLRFPDHQDTPPAWLCSTRPGRGRVPDSPLPRLQAGGSHRSGLRQKGGSENRSGPALHRDPLACRAATPCTQLGQKTKEGGVPKSLVPPTEAAQQAAATSWPATACHPLGCPPSGARSLSVSAPAAPRRPPTLRTNLAATHSPGSAARGFRVCAETQGRRPSPSRRVSPACPAFSSAQGLSFLPRCPPWPVPGLRAKPT